MAFISIKPGMMRQVDHHIVKIVSVKSLFSHCHPYYHYECLDRLIRELDNKANLNNFTDYILQFCI